MPITVNGAEISDQAINIESANYEGGSIDGRQRQAAVALTIRELLRQRASEAGLSGDLDDDEILDELLGRDVSLPKPDDADCRRYYERNRERFRVGRAAAVRHILLAVPPDDMEGRLESRDLAERLLGELSDDTARFAELAGRYSRCPSASIGGDLGVIEPGSTVPEFERVVFRLPEGLAGRPVESRYGWHVVMVDRQWPGEIADFDSVRATIADYLRETNLRRALNQYLWILANDADIQGIDLQALASVDT